MSDEPYLASPATMSILDEYGKGDTVEIKGLTISLDATPLPAHPIPKINLGVHSVTGTIEAYWTAPQLKGWYRAAQAAMTNRVLRMARPHMAKRQFQRLRGEMRAKHRKAWREA